MVMAQLIVKAALPALAPSMGTIYVPPEKLIMGERLQPWELLHHPGYWYRNAARHQVRRRALAHTIPEEHRRPPGSSPASVVASKSYAYDTYMCPEPHEEFPLEGQGTQHGRLVMDCFEAARAEFQSRKQLRCSTELALESAREMARIGAWEETLKLLQPLWDDASFRAEGWSDITEDLGWLLRAAAAEVGMASLVVSIDWTLLHRRKLRHSALLELPLTFSQNLLGGLSGITIWPSRSTMLR